MYIGYYNGHSGGLDALNAGPARPSGATPTPAIRSRAPPPWSTTPCTSRPSTRRAAYGLNAVTGKKVFFYPDGSYTPVVANPNSIFLMGKYVIYKFVPKK